MSVLQSDVAVNNSNQVITLVQQMAALGKQAAAIMAVNTSSPIANLWNVLNTTVLASDGTLGTADGTPNTAHPVDPRVYPAISRTVSPTGLTQALQVLADFNTFMAGTAVSANAARPAQVNAVAM